MKEFVDKLIERLEEEKSDWNCDYNVPINKTIEIVKDLASEYNNGWIPCEVRLPEDACWVMACDFVGNVHIFFYANGYFRESWGGKPITEQYERFHVPIAWQPLPPAYKKGE